MADDLGQNLIASEYALVKLEQQLAVLRRCGAKCLPGQVQRRRRIYIAGPYTKGDVAVNVRKAIEAGTRLLEKGYAPFVPHLTHFWHMLFPQDYPVWIDLDAQFVPVCDAVLRLPGESSGADEEAALAEKLGIPIYYNEEELIVKEPPMVCLTVPDPGHTSQGT